MDDASAAPHGRPPLGEGAAGCRTRVARRGESREFERLIRLVGTSFEDVSSEIDKGTAGTLLQQAREQQGRATLQEHLDQAINGKIGPLALLRRVTLPLVAVDADDALVGALQAIAPGQVMAGLWEKRWPRGDVMAVATRAAKVAALWVERPRRRSGIGTNLLLTCCDAYFSAGYRLVYGNYRNADQAEVEPFYRAAGFSILSPGEHVGLGVGSNNRVVDIGAAADQGMFYMTRPDWLRNPL